MSEFWLLITFLIISLCFGFVGYNQSSRLSYQSRLNSRPIYHASFVSLVAFIPSLLLFLVVTIGDGIYIRQAIFDFYPAEITNSDQFNEILAATAYNFRPGTRLRFDPFISVFKESKFS